MPPGGGESTLSEPRVTVAMPCFNDGEFIESAVDSVREREPVAVIVVDDASDDPTTASVLERLESSGVTVLRHDRNRGAAAARNTALAAAETRFLFTLDSDDVAMEGALAKLADRLEREVECLSIQSGSHQLLHRDARSDRRGP